MILFYLFENSCFFSTCFDGAIESIKAQKKHLMKLSRAGQPELRRHLCSVFISASHYYRSGMNLSSSYRELACAVVGQRNELQKFFVRPKVSFRQQICVPPEIDVPRNRISKFFEPLENMIYVVEGSIGSVGNAASCKPRRCHLIHFSAATVARSNPYGGDSGSCRSYGSHDVPKVFCGRRQHSIAKHRGKHKANHTKASSKPFPKLVHPTPFLRSIVA